MKKSLVIVAHPDDEIIWMGGTILKHKNWDWTVLSLCRKDDPDRAPKFKKVCEACGAKAIISDLDDEKLNPLSSDEIVSKIKENLSEFDYDYVFTHGENGEYGHIRHKEIHHAVKEMIRSKELNCKKLYFFAYKPGKEIAPHDPNLKIPVPKLSADFKVELDDKIYKTKVKTVTDLYGFKPDIFETLSCNRMESFVQLR